MAHDRRLRSAGHHDIDLIILDHAQGISYRIIARGTARTARNRMSLDSQLVRDFTAAGAAVTVDQRKRVHPSIALFQVRVFCFVSRFIAAHRSALNHAYSIGIEFRKIDLRLFHRQSRGSHAVLQRSIQSTRRFLIHITSRVETLNFRGNARGGVGGVEPRHRCRRADPVPNRVPKDLKVLPVGRDHPHAGDDDPTSLIKVGSHFLPGRL